MKLLEKAYYGDQIQVDKTIELKLMKKLLSNL